MVARKLGLMMSSASGTCFCLLIRCFCPISLFNYQRQLHNCFLVLSLEIMDQEAHKFRLEIIWTTKTKIQITVDPCPVSDHVRALGKPNGAGPWCLGSHIWGRVVAVDMKLRQSVAIVVDSEQTSTKNRKH